MSNKDLLKLENEYRNEILKSREKPKIEFVGRSNLVKRIPEFLAKASQDVVAGKKSSNSHVEMDILITPPEIETGED